MGGGPARATATALARLAALGVSARSCPGERPGTERVVVDGADGEALAGCDLSWFGPASVGAGRAGSEAVVQALTGLMAVHGRDYGAPRPVGLEVASVAAGILAGEAVLAGLVAAAGGQAPAVMSTSVVQAGLLVCSHYIAAATSRDDPGWPAPAPEPGPPFSSADGVWFEMDTLDPESWKAFWHRLGAAGADLGGAWTRFRLRYFSGTCTLPPGLHAATASRPMSEVLSVAEDCGVSVSVLRHYPEVVSDISPADGHPVVEPPADAHGAAGDYRQAGPGGAGAGPLHGPLHGVVVVEATSRMQGPLASLLLQMLGARVVKIEPPGGDVGRMMAPLAGDVGSFFACWNRGKESVELDLASPAGRAELEDLLDGADVFIHNWRPGRAERWSLGAADLARRQPQVVNVRASGWGPRAERDRVLGLEYLVQAYAGFGDGLNPPGQPPRTARILLVDFMGALVTCEGALAGLYRRCGDGRGRPVVTSLLAGAVALEADVLDGVLRRGESGRPAWGPLDVPVATTDGYVVVGAGGDGAVKVLCDALGAGSPGPAAATRALAATTAGGAEAALEGTGLPFASVRTDLSSLPADAALGPLLVDLGGGSRAPVSPWAAPP